MYVSKNHIQTYKNIIKDSVQITLPNKRHGTKKIKTTNAH